MRRRIVDEHVNHERWLISYADFITLLFAFFVVMYSISQVNKNKYRVLSDTLAESFHSNARVEGLTMAPTQVGESPRSNPINLIELNDPAVENDTKEDDGKEFEGKGEGPLEGEMPTEFQEMTGRVEALFGDLISSNKIDIRGNEEWLEIELSSSLLFESGRADINVAALTLLAEVADLIKGQPNSVKVEGFTDNIPINTAQFPSNWELSTARASAIVQLFVEEQVDPARLAAIGYGEYQPIADNSTPQGREKNRRVVLMISKKGDVRPSLPRVAQTSDATPKEQALETQPPTTEDTLGGVEAIELEGGGLLFTNDPARANENR